VNIWILSSVDITNEQGEVRFLICFPSLCLFPFNAIAAPRHLPSPPYLNGARMGLSSNDAFLKARRRTLLVCEEMCQQQEEPTKSTRARSKLALGCAVVYTLHNLIPPRTTLPALLSILCSRHSHLIVGVHAGKRAMDNDQTAAVFRQTGNPRSSRALAREALFLPCACFLLNRPKPKECIHSITQSLFVLLSSFLLSLPARWCHSKRSRRASSELSRTKLAPAASKSAHSVSILLSPFSRACINCGQRRHQNGRAGSREAQPGATTPSPLMPAAVAARMSSTVSPAKWGWSARNPHQKKKTLSSLPS